ncbi:MAG: glycerol-3-phosphate 1-O-acyltransferase PlsY [Planctomycetes bacterium]|nr:glycerol-3-phosphate 1-O-acyltransferase PlsY [Planctomycetota bacterium]
MIGWLTCIVGGYLVGSIPFGVIIGRAKGIDIREHGSKNIGATNVTRVLGRRLGILCFFLDVSKGALPVVIGGVVNNVINRPAAMLHQQEMWLWLAVACAAIFGHMYSPFLKWRGGKGVATGFGAMAAMWPLLTPAALGAMIVWYGTLRLTKYVSVASMLAAASMPVGYLLSVLPNDALEMPLAHSLDAVVHGSPPVLVTTAMALLVVYKHRSNIARLRRGLEPKVRGRARRGAMPSASPPQPPKTST